MIHLVVQPTSSVKVTYQHSENFHPSWCRSGAWSQLIFSISLCSYEVVQPETWKKFNYPQWIGGLPTHPVVVLLQLKLPNKLVDCISCSVTIPVTPSQYDCKTLIHNIKVQLKKMQSPHKVLVEASHSQKSELTYP